MVDNVVVLTTLVSSGDQLTCADAPRPSDVTIEITKAKDFVQMFVCLFFSCDWVPRPQYSFALNCDTETLDCLSAPPAATVAAAAETQTGNKL